MGQDVRPKVRLHDPLFTVASRRNSFASLADISNEAGSTSGKRRRKKGGSKKGASSSSLVHLPDLVDEANTPGRGRLNDPLRSVPGLPLDDENCSQKLGGRELESSTENSSALAEQNDPSAVRGSLDCEAVGPRPSEVLAQLNEWVASPARRDDSLESTVPSHSAVSGKPERPTFSAPEAQDNLRPEALAQSELAAAIEWATKAGDTGQLGPGSNSRPPDSSMEGSLGLDLQEGRAAATESEQQWEPALDEARCPLEPTPAAQASSSGTTERCKDEDLLVKYGVLGCAAIAKKIVRGMCLAKGVKAAAIASRTLYKAKQFAKEMKHLAGVGPKCYGSYEELLEILRRGGNLKPYGNYDALVEDPLVDIVYIPLPTSLHVEWATKAASKQKHVLLEKPPALTLEEMDKMLDSCGHAGVQYMDATMWLHNPRSKAIKAILDKPHVFGQIKRVTTSYTHLLEYPETNIRANPDLDGLGALGDLGWHCIGFSLWVFDWEMPREVVAQPGTRCNGKGVITSCGATLEWEDGRLASFDCSYEEAMRQDATIASNKAVLKMDDFVVPVREDFSTFTVSSKCGLVKQGTAVGTEVKGHRVETKRPQEACMVQEMARLVANIQDGIGLVDERWAGFSRKTLLVLLAVEESIRQGGAAVVIEEDKPDNSDDEYL